MSDNDRISDEIVNYMNNVRQGSAETSSVTSHQRFWVFHVIFMVANEMMHINSRQDAFN